MQILFEQNAFPSDLFRVIDENGKILNSELIKKIDSALILDFYCWMKKMRIADAKIISLQRTGRLGTYPSILGQEACQVACGLSLNAKQDFLVPTFRETGMMWAYGIPLWQILLYWMGNEQGSKFNHDVNCFPIAIPVGSHMMHAFGLAYANKFLKKDGIVLSSSGDGSTSEGDFHAALNFSGVFKTPNIFFIQNNQYAISTPYKKQTAAETIAQKAFSYGIKAAYIDGNDVLALYLAISEAKKSASLGESVLIEAVTYRISDHTTSDNAKLYRDESEVESWLKYDPVKRIEIFLKKSDVLNDKKIMEIEREAKELVENEIEKALSHPKLNPENMFTMLYEKMPEEIVKQRKEFSSEIF